MGSLSNFLLLFQGENYFKSHIIDSSHIPLCKNEVDGAQILSLPPFLLKNLLTPRSHELIVYKFEKFIV
jgi:hypothetical protein